MKRIIFFIIFLLLFLSLPAEHVSFEEARIIARNWAVHLKENFNDHVSPASGESIVKDGIEVAYVFRFLPRGYVIVSAEDYLPPVKMYSLNNNFGIEGKEVEEMVFKQYREIIGKIRAEGIDPARVFMGKNKTAFERFRKRLGDDADLIEGLGEDVLPASLEISLEKDWRNESAIAAVVERLRKDHRFNDLQYGQGWLEKLEAFLLLLRASGLALGGFLVFAALVIVANTIKLTLYARQDELEAMTMVGGTSLFIKLPYLIEGALQGLLGGVTALALSFLVFEVLLQQSLGSMLLITGIDSIHFLPPIWQGLLIVGGGLIGLLGSLFALRKFVRFGAP